MSSNKRVDEARETILRACCGECGRMTPPDENVHGSSGVPFFLCSICWGNGVRFEARMAELGWVPKDTAGDRYAPGFYHGKLVDLAVRVDKVRQYIYIRMVIQSVTTYFRILPSGEVTLAPITEQVWNFLEEA